MLLLRSILRRSLGEFLGEITGESLGEMDFLAVLDFSCCNRFSLKDFTRSSFNQGLGPWGLSTSGTAKVSGLVVCWAIFLGQLGTVGNNPAQRGCLASFQLTAWLGVRGNVQGNGVGSSSCQFMRFACLSLSAEMGLGGDKASALPSGSPFNVTPPRQIPCQRSQTSSHGSRGTWREATVASWAFVKRYKAAC